MDKITVSAPGKLMLLGEHSVVYNNPSLVTAVNQRIKLTLETKSDETFCLNAEDVGVFDYVKPLKEIGAGELPKGVRFVEIALKNIKEKYQINSGLKITANSEFSSEFGFGSSSASTVCTVFGVSKLLNLNLSQKEIFDISYKTVLDIQGKGSGFDIASAIYGGVLYFVTAGQKIEPLEIDDIPLLVTYSGKKGDTTQMLNMVKEKMETHKDGVNEIFKNISNLVEESKTAMLEKDWSRLGTLMNFNQDYLEDLGVSTEILDDMIIAARNAGAYGAKLSGAGGGDCMIALVDEEKRKLVSDAITKAGGQILDVKMEKAGVQMEVE